jgi:hypothetical protein
MVTSPVVTACQCPEFEQVSIGIGKRSLEVSRPRAKVRKPGDLSESKELGDVDSESASLPLREDALSEFV